MRVLLFGPDGQVGQECLSLLRERGDEVVPLSKEEADLTTEHGTDRILSERPDVVLNAAAYTAVDKAEQEREICKEINALAVHRMVENCRKVGCSFLHISTDYVFDGKLEKSSCYDIDSKTNPINVYGETKRLGELFALGYGKSFVVRTSWVFGKGKNFVKTMLRLFENHKQVLVVQDQIGSPTYAKDLARLLCDMITTERYGLYHATNEGFCSWYDFAKAISERSRKDVTIIPVTTAQYQEIGHPLAKRPMNSKLSKKSLLDNHFSLLPDWRDALRRFLTEGEIEK